MHCLPLLLLLFCPQINKLINNQAQREENKKQPGLLRLHAVFMSCMNFMPADALHQSCCDDHSKNLSPNHNDSDCSDQALVTLDPTRDSTHATTQKDHTLSCELIQELGSYTTLWVPNRPVLQRVQTACCRNTTSQHSWSWAVVISEDRTTISNFRSTVDLLK